MHFIKYNFWQVSMSYMFRRLGANPHGVCQTKGIQVQHANLGIHAMHTLITLSLQ
jgi:hypothetical protein